MKTILGKKISTLRHNKKLKQDELAEMLGVSPQAVSKWENDQTCPDISLLPNLAKILGTSIDDLLSEKDDNSGNVTILPIEERKDIKDMMLRIVIKSAIKDKIKMNFPLALLQVAIDNGISISQFSNNDSLKNIDLTKIMNLVSQGVIGNLLEIETENGDIISIFVE